MLCFLQPHVLCRVCDRVATLQLILCIASYIMLPNDSTLALLVATLLWFVLAWWLTLWRWWLVGRVQPSARQVRGRGASLVPLTLTGLSDGIACLLSVDAAHA